LLFLVSLSFDTSIQLGSSKNEASQRQSAADSTGRQSNEQKKSILYKMPDFNVKHFFRTPAFFLLLLICILLGVYFAPESSDPQFRPYPCQHIDSESKISDFILPYSSGTGYKVNQANCSGHGHNNFWNHGYDFVMDVGTPVSASRAGVVGWTKDGCIDGDHNCTNLITILHADGTVALYSHLTKGGVKVKQGQRVQAGQFIGKSGNTGNTGGLPHLHFSVHPCNELPGFSKANICPSVPMNFRNTVSNPHGLAAGNVYVAN
jgi:murein DD-endopeptidase MepM/ murein hydrolase activator NlpD